MFSRFSINVLHCLLGQSHPPFGFNDLALYLRGVAILQTDEKISSLVKKRLLGRVSQRLLVHLPVSDASVQKIRFPL